MGLIMLRLHCYYYYSIVIIINIFFFFHLVSPTTSASGPQLQQQQQLPLIKKRFGPFNSSYYEILSVGQSSTISNGALQITPDSANKGFSLQNQSGRILYSKSPFRLWDSERIASFNTSFLINIFRFPNSTFAGEGVSFIIAPDLQTPPGSAGQYLGLTNASTDGNPGNHLIAIELDTFKQSFDPDNNHLGLDINSVRSTKTVSLSDHGIELAPLVPKNYTVWIQYEGEKKVLMVYMAEQGKPIPSGKPLLIQENLSLREYVRQDSFLGFAGSTGNWTQLNCVLEWNLTVENLSPQSGDDGRKKKKKKEILAMVGSGVAIVVVVVLAMVVGVGGWYYWRKKRRENGDYDRRILGALKSLPGTPREFNFKDLKKATNNFDEKMKLGQGGFGVVYKGLLPKENTLVAVKKFSRDSIKEGKDDFLAELTIINRLRHKHLVRLVGWCHKNEMLLLVYDYMPNGSLDKHLFFFNHHPQGERGEEEDKNTILRWDHRYKIVSGVASALHYLHNEYDQKVIHRDLKASNIMLDSDYNARLGDFGLARALDHEKTSYAELEGIPGTLGYIAPECFHTGKATPESDVYGFGAVVLEVVCGQRPWINTHTAGDADGFQFLVDWVWALHRQGRILDAVDEKLGRDYTVEEAERLLLLGLACSHPIAGQRPNMQEVVQIISGSVQTPRVPHFKPAFMWPSRMGGSMEEEEEDSTMTTNEYMNMTADTTPMTSSLYGGSGWTPHSVAPRNGFYSDSSVV